MGVATVGFLEKEDVLICWERMIEGR